MTQERAEQIAEEFKTFILARTGLKAEQLVCPREKSDMTPCAARDGRLVAVLDSFDHPICVGCEAHIDALLERAKQHPPKRVTPAS